MSIDRQRVRHTMKLRRGMVDLASKRQGEMLAIMEHQEAMTDRSYRVMHQGYAVQVRIAEALEAILAIARAEHSQVEIDLGPTPTRTY